MAGIVRARLLPTQIMDGPDHHLGALGWLVGATNGKSAVTDIRVIFHFDDKDSLVSVASVRGQPASVTVDIPSKKNLFIRIPGWTPNGSVEIKVNGNDEAVIWQGAYIFIPGREEGLQVRLHYELPERVETEFGNLEYQFKWRGDEVIDVSPNEGPRFFSDYL